MDITRAASEGLKVWLCFAGILLLLRWREIPRAKAKQWLIALTLLAGLNYARFGTKSLFKHIDSYDVLHYYVGAKYFEELGYYDLYPALILADQEHPKRPYSRRLRNYHAQDKEHGYRHHRPIREAVARGKVVREEKFSAERWSQFKQDFYHLQRDYNMTPKYWRQMMGDRGFNGTPVWLLVGQPIASILPATFARAFCFLDVLWLIIALGVIRWAYEDWVPVLWATFFLFVTYSLRWPIPGQAFLRYDWVGSLLIAMALLRKGKNFLGGSFAAFAALLRFFPAIWLLGPALKGLSLLIWPAESKPLEGSPPAAWRSRLDKSLLLVAAGFITIVVVLEGAALVSYGSEAVETHAENIREHVKPEELSSRRMGFALAYTYDGELKPKYITHKQKLRVRDTAKERMVLSLLLFLALGLGVRRLRNDEVYALGYIPFFMLATGSYYYAVARITLIVFHAQDLSKQRNRIGLASLLGLELFSNYAETTHPGHRVYLIGHLSWGLTAYALLIVGWLLFEEYRELKTSKKATITPAKSRTD